MREIIQLTVSLRNSNPLVWRSLHINSQTTFFELHHIIQIAMGWKNYHLFQFNLDGYKVGMIDEDEPGSSANQLIDATKTLLTDILSDERDNFEYNYDFGDGWLHDIELEKKQEKDDISFPRCIFGQQGCPPEDCGGIQGYHYLLKVLQIKSHPEYEETRDRVGQKYDPLVFDLKKVNHQLKQLKRYITRWNSPD